MKQRKELEEKNLSKREGTLISRMMISGRIYLRYLPPLMIQMFKDGSVGKSNTMLRYQIKGAGLVSQPISLVHVYH